MDPGDRQDRPPLWPFLTGVAATAAVLAAAWWLFYHWREPTYVLTARKGMLPLPPLYAYLLPEPTPYVLLAVALLVAGLAAWRMIPARRQAAFLACALLFAAAFRLAVHAAALPELPGKEMLLWGGEDIISDADRVDGIARFLGDYTRVQPFLSIHGQHHPPGYAILHSLIRRVAGADVRRVGTLLTLLASLVVLPVYFLGKRLRGRIDDGRAAALLVAVLPGMVSYGAVSLDAVFAALAALIYAVLLREIDAPAVQRRIAAGLLLSVAMMLSYSAFVAGLLCALLVALSGWRRPVFLLRRAAEIGAAFVVPLILLYLITGFDAWECFANARALNAHLMTRTIGKDPSSFPVWTYASVGNLLAFLIDLGVPVVAGWALLARHRLAAREAIILIASAATLLVACFGGIYFMETERILLFLVPPVTLVALLSDRFRAGAAAVLAGLQAIVMEVLLYRLW